MNRVRFFVLVVFFCFLFYSSSSFSSDSPFSNHPEGQTSVFVGDGRGFYGLDEDKRHSVVQEREIDPYQSLSTYKEHLKKLLQSGSYFKLALNVSFCAFFVTSLFILPTCLVIYAFMTQPEKLFFDILYEKIESLIDPLKDKDIVVTGSQVGDSLSYFFKNSTNLTSLVFLAAGEVMNHHGYSEEYYRLVSIINERIGSFFKTRRHKGAFNNTGGFLTRFCFDPHDQEYDVETLVSENSISDPLDVVLKKECSDRQVFVTQNIGDFHKWTDRGLFYFSPSFYSLSVHVHDVYRQVFNTQRRLMQIGGETSKEEYLTTVEEDFLKKTDTQSLLTMVVDSLLSHQCPSEGLFDRLSTSLKGLRNPLKYIGDKYLQIKLWYREDGSIRHVVAVSANNITDRSTNHNETTLCNFASEAHLEGADARLDLDRFRYLRVIAGGRDLSFTLPPTITHALQKTFTDHFSKEHTASKTLTDQKTDTHTHTENHTKSISLLSREQYFDLLAKGVWFNESDAYLNSIFPEIGGLSIQENWGRWSDANFNAARWNVVNLTTKYPLPQMFNFSLLAYVWGADLYQKVEIFLDSKYSTGPIVTSQNTDIDSDSDIESPNIKFDQTVTIENKFLSNSLILNFSLIPKQLSFIKFNMQLISVSIVPIYINQTNYNILNISDVVNYFNKTSLGLFFNSSIPYDIFSTIKGLKTDIYWRYWLKFNLLSNNTLLKTLYDLPNNFTIQLIGHPYLYNENTMMRVSFYNSYFNSICSVCELYTGTTANGFSDTTNISLNGNNSSFIKFEIPNPTIGDRSIGIGFSNLKIIPLP